MGRPLRSAHRLHAAMKEATQLNCSVGIGTSRLIAKVSSAKAKPNGVLWVLPGQEAKFLAPLDVGDIPGVGKVMEQKLHAMDIERVGDLAKLEDRDLEERFGKWGLALAGKSRGEDAGGWFDTEVGENVDPKSISHEHTFNEDTGDAERLQSTLMRLSEMVGTAAARRRIFRAHDPIKTAVQGFHDHHAGAFAGAADPDGQSDFRAGATAVFRELEGGCGGAAAGRAGVEFRIGAGAA